MRTKLLALTYSAWSEAQFSQIVYTPNAFSQDEIAEILRVKKSGITVGWSKIIQISFSRINSTNNNEILNRKDKLINYIDTYIFKQSQLRNKIAHGQWMNALEDNTTKTLEYNQSRANDFNIRLNNLNVIDIMKEFEVHTTLGKIIRDLVQSPNKGFSKNYDKYLLELDEYLEKSSLWNMESKKNQLSKKPKRIICQKCKKPVSS